MTSSDLRGSTVTYNGVPVMVINDEHGKVTVVTRGDKDGFAIYTIPKWEL